MEYFDEYGSSLKDWEKNQNELLNLLCGGKSDYAYSLASIMKCIKEDNNRKEITDKIDFLVKNDRFGTINLSIRPANLSLPIVITVVSKDEMLVNQFPIDDNLKLKNLSEKNKALFSWFEFALPFVFIPTKYLPKWIVKRIRMVGDEKLKEEPSLGAEKLGVGELTYRKRLRIFIEMLNCGYIPRNDDQVNKFTGTNRVIKQFWDENKYKIKDILENDKAFSIGYDTAKQIVNDALIKKDKKLEIYIELLNTGHYIPMTTDRETCFPGTNIKINTFWPDNRKKIKELLDNNDEYQEGYENAKHIVEESFLSPSEKMEKYIELLNTGKYVPKADDKSNVFPETSVFIRYFWFDNKEEIEKLLFYDEKYLNGYDVARFVLNLYKELLNNGVHGSNVRREFKRIVLETVSSNDTAKKIALENGWLQLEQAKTLFSEESTFKHLTQGEAKSSKL